MISIVVLTKDEEIDIASCLNSLAWCDDLHVLDSGSIDKTLTIVREHGAIISSHPFKSFGQQRNYALDAITFKHEWILFLDADERATEKFKTALFRAIQEADSSVAGFYCCWKMILEGKWLKYCDNYPKWQFRLLRKGRARFTDFGHGQKEDNVSGEIKYLLEPYLHYGFSKGWSHWYERHNKYSSQEAFSRLYNRPPLRTIFSRHSSVRNPALKSWLSAIPGWPLVRFIQAYFLKLGFLEGVQGFIYCSNMAYYEFSIQLKMRELKRKNKLTNIQLGKQ